MDMGSRLRSLMEEQNLSQKEFADILHIDYHTVNGYVKNRRQPDCEMLLRIAECLNSSTDYITGRTTIRYQKDAGCSREEGVLVGNFRGLNAEMRQTLLDISISLYKNQCNRKV